MAEILGIAPPSHTTSASTSGSSTPISSIPTTGLASSMLASTSGAGIGSHSAGLGANIGSHGAGIGAGVRSEPLVISSEAKDGQWPVVPPRKAPVFASSTSGTGLEATFETSAAEATVVKRTFPTFAKASLGGIGATFAAGAKPEVAKEDAVVVEDEDEDEDEEEEEKRRRLKREKKERKEAKSSAKEAKKAKKAAKDAAADAPLEGADAVSQTETTAVGDGRADEAAEAPRKKVKKEKKTARKEKETIGLPAVTTREQTEMEVDVEPMTEKAARKAARRLAKATA